MSESFYGNDIYGRRTDNRCKRCLHKVCLHIKKSTGRGMGNGYCRAKYCLCNVPLGELING